MTKEEQIKEMANDLSKCSFFYNGNCLMNYSKTAKFLYQAGYRKIGKNYIGTDEVLRSIDYRPTEEVRKETAKDILLDMIADILSLAQKYGVEVEE